jgi:hypothetical protein
MTRPHPTTHLLVLALAAAGLAGCGSGATPNRAATAPAHAAFLSSVDRTCAHAVRAEHRFPLAHFDPERPDPDQLPAVGDFFARYSQLPRIMTALHALTPPAADAARWRALLAVADRYSENAQRQITVARAKDVPGFVATVHLARRLSDELDADGLRLGLDAKSPCGQVFG